MILTSITGIVLLAVFFVNVNLAYRRDNLDMSDPEVTRLSLLIKRGLVLQLLIAIVFMGFYLFEIT